MSRAFLLLSCLVSACLAGDDWRPLFNGKDLDGWEQIMRPSGAAGFAADDGVLRSTGKAKGMIWYSREKIGNATLRLVYRMSNDKGNSGIFIRIPDKPATEDDAIHKGIEVQIDNNDDDWHSTGTLYSMTKALARPYKPAGEWNTMDITIDGLRTLVHLNGVLVTGYDGVAPVPERTKPWEPKRGPRPAEGYIGIQTHDPRAVLSFREIGVRRPAGK